MFEFLFNHSLDTWEGARLAFARAWPWWLIALAFALGIFSIAVSLIRLPVSLGRRFTIGTIQAALLTLVIGMLLQPVLLTEEVRRDDNAVAVILDSSNSMNFAANREGDSETRLIAAQSAVAGIRNELSDSFDTRYFSIGEELRRVSDPTALEIDSARTDLAGGLSELLDQAAAGELAAVVLVSDGGNNASKMDVAWWNHIRQAEIPIHTVGVGPETVAGDFELAEVALPKQVAANVSVTARVRIRHPEEASAVRLRVKQGDELKYAQTLSLNTGAKETSHELKFPAGSEGIQALEFELQPLNGEANVVNNRVEQILPVVNKPKRILYVEGEPRWEYKFLRRAVSEDAGLEVVSLLRTSPNKFYRQGVLNSRELENGFPLTREALFGYDAIIIGSLDAAELSIEQQANVRDFVAERAGALLMLGGSRGLADGGWGRSAVQAALPVALEAGEQGKVSKTFQRERSAVQLTEFGRRADWLTLPAAANSPNFDGEGSADALNSSDAAWASLPELDNVQQVGEPRAGAQVLLQTQVGEQPVLTWHRYGKGRSYVLATSGTWRWQMSLPFEDTRHEVFWQNFLAELALAVPSRISIDVGPVVQRDQQSATLSVMALGPDFSPHTADSLAATVTRPNGSEISLSLTPNINRPGEFQGAFEYDSVGAHSLRVSIEDPTDTLEVNVHQGAASAESWWMVESDTAEFFSPELQSTVLQRIANETSGSYRLLNEIGALPAALMDQNNALTRQNEWPLWNMPALFLLLLLGKLVEWLLRLRWKRL